MASIPYLPLDIWREILILLPGESLIRARNVSKGLRAVIDDPGFVRAHTSNRQQKLSSNIIIRNSIVPSSAVDSSCYSLDSEALINFSHGHQAATATPLDLEFIRDRPRGLSFPVAVCNGLVLSNKPLTIWNALTHERLPLPQGYVKYVRAFGLGYDGTTDDYKAVVILRSRETRVYSLRSDSWRSNMDCPCEGRAWQGRLGAWRGPYGPGVFVCGALNWLSTTGEGGACEDKILALDLGTEKYSLLQMPPHTRLRYPNGVLLNVLGGCLALCDSGYRSHLEVWVMKVYGDDYSWFKLFSIERSEQQNNKERWGGFLRPIAFIMKERLVFLEEGCHKFFQFDVETKSLKRVEMDGSIIPKGSFLYSHTKQLFVAIQMFVGNIFRLHANCGGGVRNIATSCNKKKTKKKKN